MDHKAMGETGSSSISLAILFLCTGNSCRSQIAEGFARSLFPSNVEVYSAGISPVGVNSYAMRVMDEEGVDIRSQKSKGLSRIPLDKIDTVITLCGHADTYCPTINGSVEKYHWPIDDPVGTRGTEEEILNAFRKTREEIKNRILNFLQDLKTA